MALSVEIAGVDQLARAFDSLPSVLESGVKVSGEASAYALVWEWGSARITKPGPKTTWGTNPNGDRVVLTLTAPQGYIRINEPRYLDILKEEFGKVDWGSVLPSGMNLAMAMKEMLISAAKRCADVIRDAAPVDTGALRSAIEAVGPGDPVLSETGRELDLGEEWL